MVKETPYSFLLAIDGSTHANRAAAYLAGHAARLRPCEVHLVKVLTLRMAALLTPQQQSLLRGADSDTAPARRMLDAAGIDYRFHCEWGNPSDRIIDLVRSQGCEEVVVGSRGMSALESFAFGSVAYKIVHLSPVPVTVVPNPTEAHKLGVEDRDGIHRILLAVDGSSPAAKAVDYVCSLRDARIPVGVQLLSVQIPIASRNVQRFVPQDTIDAYYRAEGEEALDAAKKSLQEAGLAFDEHILIGHPGQTIVSQASHWRCSRIVMGTRGLGALANVMIGSTALQVMHLSQMPVTLVK